MLILRQCAVPKMNFLMRCLPPSCMAEQAEAFDNLVVQAAKTKIRIHADEATQETTRLMRAKLRHGGFGLTSAIQTSPAAYLGSLSTVGSAPAFTAYSKADGVPLPSDSLLHSWIENSMKTITATTPESGEHLPTSASSFFRRFSKSPSFSSSLQHLLSEQASD